MPYEIGGRADKLGNKYEFNWIVLKFIDIIAEKIDAIKIEPIGPEADRVDVLVRYRNGSKEAQQCKGRNASKENWSLADLNQRGILNSWRRHLERDPQVKVSLVSPLPFISFSDLIYRAKTNDDDQYFIEYQVQTSSVISSLLNDYIKYLGFSKEKDIRKVIDFLSRTVIRQEPYPDNEEFIKDKVSQYFIGDATSIKSKFINLILQGEIYGRWLSFQDLEKFIKNEKIEFRNLARDDRIMPRIHILNDEYKNSFKTLDSGLKIRTQFDECKKYIQEGKSIIIHGKAGNGKSGLTENIIDWCNKSNILHLDLKLDCYIPEGTAQGWGEKLGFPASISYCLNAFSKENNVVLILDQLDALERSNSFSDSFYGSHCGSVVSPLQGKDISAKSWRNILISSKGETKCRWDSERQIFIESSPRELARDFRNAVSKNPKEYVSLFLNLSSNHKINEHYIDGLLGGIVDLEKIPDPVLSDLEFILLNFVNENNWENLYYFFRVIEEHASMGWSDEVFGKLNYYLKKTDLDVLDKFNENQTLENYLQQSYSTLRGHGIHALTKLIENSPTNISYFKNTIISLANDKTDYVRLNTIFLLYIILDLDKDFARELFRGIFTDEKMIIHWYSNYILFRLYEDEKERIQSLLQLAFDSKDTLLVKNASFLITEIYLNKGEMESSVYSGSALQAEGICQMAINYLKVKNHEEKSKKIILHYLSENITNLEKILPQLFRDGLLDIKEDRDLILKLLTSEYKDKLYYYFLESLEKQVSISNYTTIIFETVSNIVSKNNKLKLETYYYRRIEEYLSRLMIQLYDEHKGDDVADNCLDIIDQMFENEFGSSRILIEELMNK